jgi:flagellar biogenesis protein FliO
MNAARAMCLLMLAWSCGGAAATPAAPARLPFKQETVQDQALAWQAGTACLAACALAAAAIFAIRRHGAAGGRGRRATARLDMLEMKRVGKHSHLIVVRYGNEELLLGEGSQGLQLLARLAQDAALAAGTEEK